MEKFKNFIRECISIYVKYCLAYALVGIALNLVGRLSEIDPLFMYAGLIGVIVVLVQVTRGKL